MQNIKKTLLVFLVCIFALFNNGCLTKEADESAPVNASFTNLTEDTVLLYIDGKIETQIFPQTAYWVGLADGHHKYSVLHRTTREELMAGEFRPGDRINIMPKTLI